LKKNLPKLDFLTIKYNNYGVHGWLRRKQNERSKKLFLAKGFNAKELGRHEGAKKFRPINAW
jgi:hypothetical protein